MDIFRYQNLTQLCGNQSLYIWDEDLEDFGQCFTSLALVTPAHAVLAVVCAYYVGFRPPRYYIRSRTQKLALYLRSLSTLTMASLPVLSNVLLYVFKTQIFEDEGLSDLIETVAQVLSWILLFAYTVLLFERMAPSSRGHTAVILSWGLTLVADAVQSRSILILYSPSDAEHKVMYAYAVVQVACHTVFLLTLLPASPEDGSSSNYEELDVAAAGSGPINNTYGGFHEPHDPSYLGVAKENAVWLSRLLLYWVYPLIRKGRRSQINSPDDVFDLPLEMSAPVVSEAFQRSKSRYEAVLRALWHIYWKPFLAVGTFKFLADICGFASPLLLNAVINFMEDRHADVRWGYLYAIGLCASTGSVALLSTHFNLYMTELTIKIRSALITAIYKHALTLPSYVMKQGKYTIAEVINFVGTDTDRIVNVVPSFHSLWSLPFQLSVTFFLLYQQVKYAFLPGVGITLLLIPINKAICGFINKYSTRMMTAKDARVKQMSETLSGIRVIKYFVWERHFTNQVEEIRLTELQWLKYRKYLDAFCVFLWAFTPVAIAMSTFVTYTLAGLGNLSASKVFTSVALFQMMNGPLNAFPWVLNGMVEALVSMERIGQYLQMKATDRLESDFYDEPEDDSIISLQSATFAHSNQPDSFKISDLNLSIKVCTLHSLLKSLQSGLFTWVGRNISALVGCIKKLRSLYEV